MTSTERPGVEIAPPAVEPYRYGLLSAAVVSPSATDVQGRRWEDSGVLYLSDGCAPGGGIWVDPCWELPPPLFDGAAYRVTFTKAIGADTVVATLAERAAEYAGAAVTVRVGNVSHQLGAVGDSSPAIPVQPGTTVPVASSIAPVGRFPACSEPGWFEVPATGVEGSLELICTLTVPGDRSVKAIGEGFGWVTGRPFIVYESARCFAGGFSDTEAADRAERRLSLQEQRWVEVRFAATELRGGETVTLAGGVALPFALAVGELEREIAARYGGIGVVHADRSAANLVDGLLKPSGAQMRTPLGNLWSFGAGYGTEGPDGAPAPPGQAWIYATGPVMAQRSEVQTRTSFDPSSNERVAISERAYVLTADCLRLAVLAELSGGA